MSELQLLIHRQRMTISIRTLQDANTILAIMEERQAQREIQPVTYRFLKLWEGELTYSWAAA